MTGGDSVQAERKYGHSFTFRSFALPIFSANEAPHSRDQTEAWFERWIIIPMEWKSESEERDQNLTAKLTTREELEGLFLVAVESLRRLMERGRFEIPDAVEKAGLSYREQIDTVAGWLAECCVFDRESKASRRDLYTSYLAWCRESGYRTWLPKNAVFSRLRSHPELRPTVQTGARGFYGIRII